ncbi:hypothetical protein CAC42_6312 [Sphaceloma murrayae]|uniref:TRUD domain-containing protein n=1 Tax=Sphaceloma murrayae TaxID=2082308 RepID=A0A2K1QTX7_9PEZI|nr:hypothetical protein CAC42_6312 [Sphaceloma murrayae]
MSHDEHARKRARLQDNDANRSVPLTLSRANQRAAAEQREQEAKFGVTAFVSEAPGFICILKQRFTDFLVNEVDLNGQPVHLEVVANRREEEKHNSSSATKVHEVHQPASGVPESAPISQSNENGENGTAAGAEGAQMPTMSPDSTAEVEAIFGKETTAHMQDLYSKILAQPGRKPKDLPQYNSEPIVDKQMRTEAHVAVRKAFQGRIETVTSDDNRITIKAGSAPRKSNRQLPSNGDGPATKGKVGWNELGGEYLHFTLYKENKDTMEVLYFIASQMKVQVKNFQFAGTKDRRGVTAQRVSAYRMTKERLQSFNPKLRNARLSSFEYRKEGLQLGDLSGNKFTIALRDCQFLRDTADTVSASIENAMVSAVSAFRENGFINYYGLQRFGTYNVTTDEIGRRMLQGDFKGAVDGILAFSEHVLDSTKDTQHGSKISEDDILRAKAIDAWNQTHKTGKAVDLLPRKFTAENAIIRHLGFVNRRVGKQERLEDWQGALAQIPRNLRLMYVHAYQSLVWNAAAAKRHELYGGSVVEGDLVIVVKENEADGTMEEVDEEGEVIIRPTGEDSATAVEDKFERARPLSRQEAESGRYSCFDIVLPQPGYDVEYPANAVGDFYKDFMARDGLDPHDMRRRWKDISLSGSYRKVMSLPLHVEHEIKHYLDDDEQLLLTDMDRLDGKANLVTHDQSAGTKVALIIKMQLASSQYATMALRELTKGGALAFKPDYSGR